MWDQTYFSVTDRQTEKETDRKIDIEKGFWAFMYQIIEPKFMIIFESFFIFTVCPVLVPGPSPHSMKKKMQTIQTFYLPVLYISLNFFTIFRTVTWI